MTRYAHITGWGMHVPDRVMTNDDIAEFVDTEDSWIRERTGIEERRIANPDESTASLGAEAALNALDIANVHPAEVDLIICSTSSPQHIFPATASLIQDRIGATNAGAFDLLAACTGFIYAMDMAGQAIRSGSIDTALIIGAETLSRIVDWSDRGTCILFGDGAGAFVMQGSEEPGGIMSTLLRSDGSGADLLTVPAGGSHIPASQHSVGNGLHFIQMNGREVFRFATRVMARATSQVVEESGLTIEDINLVIPHQANRRIIESAARGLKLPMERFAVNVNRYGNTSTASIPIATCEAIKDGRIRENDNLVFVGFGGGLTWGASAVQWTGPLETQRKVNPQRYQFMARTRSFLRRSVRRVEGVLYGQKEP